MSLKQILLSRCENEWWHNKLKKESIKKTPELNKLVRKMTLSHMEGL